MKQLTNKSLSFRWGFAFRLIFILLSIPISIVGLEHFFGVPSMNPHFMEVAVVIFLGVDFIAHSIMQYQQRLYATFWIKESAFKNRLSMKILSFFQGVIGLFAKFYALVLTTNTEKIEWLNILIISFLLSQFQRQFAGWLASMKFTSTADYPKYDFFWR